MNTSTKAAKNNKTTIKGKTVNESLKLCFQTDHRCPRFSSNNQARPRFNPKAPARKNADSSNIACGNTPPVITPSETKTLSEALMTATITNPKINPFNPMTNIDPSPKTNPPNNPISEAIKLFLKIPIANSKFNCGLRPNLS